MLRVSAFALVAVVQAAALAAAAQDPQPSDTAGALVHSDSQGAADMAAADAAKAHPADTDAPSLGAASTSDSAADSAPEALSAVSGQEAEIVAPPPALPAAEPVSDDGGAQEAAPPERDGNGTDGPAVFLAGPVVVEVGGRVFAFYRWSDEEVPHELGVDAARIDVALQVGSWLEAALEYDFAAMPSDPATGVRDAWLAVQWRRRLTATAGRFKRPFTWLSLWSKRTLPAVDRGIVEDYVSGFLSYGKRSVGAAVEGRLYAPWKLDLTAGVFSGFDPFAAHAAVRSKDVVARLEMRPVRWLRVGGGAVWKFVQREDVGIFYPGDALDGLEDVDFPPYVGAADAVAQEAFASEYSWLSGTHVAANADVQVRTKKVTAGVQGVVADNWWFHSSPKVWGVTALGAVRFRLVRRVHLEPVVLGEVFTVADGDFQWRTRLWQVAGGANLHLGDALRVMVQGALVFAQGTEAYFDESPRQGFWPGEWPGAFADARSLTVQLAFAL